jgi:rSAM/selenodomain-associated transferase 1
MSHDAAIPPIGVHVLVLAKAPRPGFVKTRLCPEYDAAEAAALATAALADTLDVVARAPVVKRSLVLDGPAELVDAPASFDVVRQRGAGLDERLANAFDDAFAVEAMPMLLVGMDTPQLTAGLLGDAAALLVSPGCAAVLGPTDDGGYWCIGLRRPQARMIVGVPMSTSTTYDAQRRRLLAHEIQPVVLPTLRDVDTADDVAIVAAQAPTTRFAALAAELGVDVRTAS